MQRSHSEVTHCMTDSPISDIHYAIGMISSIEMMDNKLNNFLITTDGLKA